MSKVSIPTYSKGEEIFNMVSHIAGGALGIVATVLCVVFAAVRHNVYGVISGAIYGATMIILYSMSSIYHGLKPHLKAKQVLRVLDHCSIYLLIAGSYTPICLCTLRETSTALGWVYFGLVWGLAIVGILLKALSVDKLKWLGLLLNIALGWCVIFVFGTLIKAVGMAGAMLLLAGGIAYTLGVIFYVIGKTKPYMHSVFHLFILVGSILQFFAILLYIM
ncbi:MAG: hemolysin III family protein [Clostridia bacterium]|nr:hemolysin III family protein [Clostridia bacterium]